MGLKHEHHTKKRTHSVIEDCSFRPGYLLAGRCSARWWCLPCANSYSESRHPDADQHGRDGARGIRTRPNDTTRGVGELSGTHRTLPGPAPNPSFGRFHLSPRNSPAQTMDG